MNLTFEQRKLLEHFITSGKEMTHKSVMAETGWKPWKAHKELHKLKLMGSILMISENRGSPDQKVYYEISNLAISEIHDTIAST